jgi:Bacterial phospho-glucose isomerase C-terminal SIS domain
MFDDALLDDATAIARYDDALRAVAGWGAQVRRAHDAAAAAIASLDESDRPRAVVAGGADGRLFRAVLEPVCPVPFVAWPHPGLPGWAGPLDLVVALSTHGSDPDSVSLVSEATRRGCRVLASAPEHSPLAEASVGHGNTLLPAGATDPLALAVPVLEALHALALGPEVPADPVATALDKVALACAPAREVGDNPAKELALACADTVPLVWGGSVLAARAARRIAEALRAASGRPVLAGDVSQLVPVIESAPGADIFADPFAEEFADEKLPTARPALILLEDGADSVAVLAGRRRLDAAAEASRVRVHSIAATEGPDVGRFAALLATGRFAAIYLSLGLGREGVPDAGPRGLAG